MGSFAISQRQRIIASAFWLVLSAPCLAFAIAFAYQLGATSTGTIACAVLFLICIVMAFLVPVKWRVALLVRLRWPYQGWS